MFPYIIIFCLLLVLAYKYDLKKGKNTDELKWRYFILVLLILFSGLRNRVGGDTIVYMVSFDYYPTLDKLSSLKWNIMARPLWVIINVVLKTIVNNFIIVQFFHAIVFHVLLYRYVSKKTDYFFSVMVVIFCMVWWDFNFEILRESLCVVIILNASIYLEEGKIKKYLLICMLAILMHAFAIIMVALILLLYYCTERVVALISIVAVVLVMLMPQQTLLDFMVMMSVAGGEDMNELVNYYLNMSRYGGSTLNLFGILYRLFLLILPFLLIISKGTIDKFEKKLLMVFMFLYFIEGFIQIFSRLRGYVTIPLIVCSINYLFNYKRKKTLNYVGIELLLVFYMYLSINAFLTPDAGMKSYRVKYDCRYIPYTSVFQKPDPVRELFYGK